MVLFMTSPFKEKLLDTYESSPTCGLNQCLHKTFKFYNLQKKINNTNYVLCENYIKP